MKKTVALRQLLIEPVTTDASQTVFSNVRVLLVAANSNCGGVRRTDHVTVVSVRQSENERLVGFTDHVVNRPGITTEDALKGMVATREKR